MVATDTTTSTPPGRGDGSAGFNPVFSPLTAEPAPFRTLNPLVSGTPDTVGGKWDHEPNRHDYYRPGSWANSHSGPAVPGRPGGSDMNTPHRGGPAPLLGTAASSTPLSGPQQSTHFFPVDPMERGQYISYDAPMPTSTVEPRAFPRDQLGSSFHQGRPNVQPEEDGAWVDELPSLAPMGTQARLPENSSWSE